MHLLPLFVLCIMIVTWQRRQMLKLFSVIVPCLSFSYWCVQFPRYFFFDSLIFLLCRTRNSVALSFGMFITCKLYRSIDEHRELFVCMCVCLFFIMSINVYFFLYVYIYNLCLQIGKTDIPNRRFFTNP